MCLLILKMPGFDLKDDDMERAFNRNDDGAGFGFYREGETFYLHKGFMEFEAFRAAYREFVRKEDKAIVHFRIGTQGAKNEANCHPHWIGGDWMMGHNGVIGDVTIKADESDTVAFARDELMPFMKMSPIKATNKHKLLDPIVLEKLEARIGSYNKLVFLSREGEHKIINEKAGHWLDGNWYSNCSYKKATVAPAATKVEPARNSRTGRFSGKGPKTDKELSHLYSEVVEVSLIGGCSFCGDPIGQPGQKTFQYNMFSGDCYCNRCVETMKGSLLLGTDTDDAVVTVPKPALLLPSPVRSEEESEASDEHAAIAAAEAATAAEKKEQGTPEKDWRAEARKIDAGMAVKDPPGKLIVDENAALFPPEDDNKVNWPENSTGIVVSGDEELAQVVI